ncbi:hypothetical protein BN2475_700031 [Paraburkholderia ribeironis]|uniref:Uncharacterized protein n=1 Tax=Paraburkholderia ribeironis TaxID=1247936 RepID=A0A1N7SHL5_9BURK|nr:hypothetical protein BN2475_700031 [Paraburkholderia ribeironis]
MCMNRRCLDGSTRTTPLADSCYRIAPSNRLAHIRVTSYRTDLAVAPNEYPQETLVRDNLIRMTKT